MKNIFDKLFCGQFRPDEAVVHNSASKALREYYLQARETFSQELPPQQQKKLSKLLLAQEDALAYEKNECFESGFCLGMMFMLETVYQVDRMLS